MNKSLKHKYRLITERFFLFCCQALRKCCQTYKKYFLRKGMLSGFCFDFNFLSVFQIYNRSQVTCKNQRRKMLYVENKLSVCEEIDIESKILSSKTRGLLHFIKFFELNFVLKFEKSKYSRNKNFFSYKLKYGLTRSQNIDNGLRSFSIHFKFSNIEFVSF